MLPRKYSGVPGKLEPVDSAVPSFYATASRVTEDGSTIFLPGKRMDIPFPEVVSSVGDDFRVVVEEFFAEVLFLFCRVISLPFVRFSSAFGTFYYFPHLIAVGEEDINEVLSVREDF